MIPSSNRAEPKSRNPALVCDEKGKDSNWKDLAERASHEQDPQRLIEMVKELCTMLDGEAKPPNNPKAPTERVENSPAESAAVLSRSLSRK